MGNICIAANSVAKNEQAKKQYKCREVDVHEQSTTTENNSNLINVDLSESEKCITNPGNSAILLNMLTNTKTTHKSYVLSLNFNITNPFLPVILNWTKDYVTEDLFYNENSPSEIHTIHNQKIGFTIYQGEKYDEPVEMYAFMSDDPTVDLEKPTIKYRKLWLKCFNEDGDPFWPKCPYIALGEHDVNQVIKLSIHVNKDGIKANMNDKNNTGKIITESSKKNKGYIFEKLIATEESTNKESTTKESSNKESDNFKGVGMSEESDQLAETSEEYFDQTIPQIDIPDDSINLISMKLFKK